MNGLVSTTFTLEQKSGFKLERNKDLTFIVIIIDIDWYEKTYRDHFFGHIAQPYAYFTWCITTVFILCTVTIYSIITTLIWADVAIWKRSFNFFCVCGVSHSEMFHLVWFKLQKLVYWCHNLTLLLLTYSWQILFFFSYRVKNVLHMRNACASDSKVLSMEKSVLVGPTVVDVYSLFPSTTNKINQRLILFVFCCCYIMGIHIVRWDIMFIVCSCNGEGL